jgi:cysteine desulfurase
LVAVQAANNETGVLQPWIEALALCREHGVPFLCDATQWLGKLPARGLGECDFLIGSAHKFGGPRGVGFLKCPSKGRFHPLLRGGGQEDGRRAGTENVAGVLSMLAALEAREAGFAAESTERVGASQAVPDVETIRERIAWREQFEQELLTAVPGARIAGAAAPRLWNTVSVIMPDMGKQPRWVIKLDKTGFAVSTGSACASGREKPSHVLDAMGCTASEASRALRFSSGWQTTKRDWSTLLEALERVFLEETRDSAGTRS